jgi:DNA-binding XRE family transcriptional regulator
LDEVITMPMTGYQMAELRKTAGLTQAELADQVGLSRKSVNEAEALKGGHVEKRTEIAVRALTLAAKARATLIAEAEQLRSAGDEVGERLYRRAAGLLTGNFATDERTIYNLALTAARLEAR